uniref:Uncharacterized protein n=1 Tax=Daphnia galeata TaxID=27404 RepID=A0A8J2WDW4_9CRUS|nr:unnamed protein product [Daphnia galeata]
MKMKLICFLFVAFVMVSVEANSIATRDIDGRVVTAAPTTSTTRDWAQVCADLCKTGDGGVLCNCELVPVRRR